MSRECARRSRRCSPHRAIWRCWYEGEPLAFRGDYYTHTLMAPNFVPKLGVWRVTSTYTLLRYARAIWFVTRGPAKEPYIRSLAQDDPKATFPAAKVRSDRGTVEIYHCTQP